MYQTNARLSPLPLLLLLPFAAVSAVQAQGPSGTEDAPAFPALPNAPAPAAALGEGSRRDPPATTTGFIPSRTLGITLRLGSGGIGLDLTRPIAPRFALRAGASFLSASGTFIDRKIQINGKVTLQDAFAGIDFYPFRNSFRITPGLSFASKTHAHATLLIPGNQSFSFGDGGDNTSDPTDPVHGTADFSFGRSISPRLTAGWANAIPHHSRRISFPLEIGAEYIAPPTARLNITGSACETDNNGDLDCGPIDQLNVSQEQTELIGDIHPLRVFPVLSIGVTYWIGHVRSKD